MGQFTYTVSSYGLNFGENFDYESVKISFELVEQIKLKTKQKCIRH